MNRTQQPIRLVIFAVSIAVLLAGTCPGAGHLFIYHIDVGQGDATLIVSPSGKTVLVDAGNNGVGTRIVVPVLKNLGIETLDYIVASHYDADHIGGVDEVIDALGLPAVAVYDRGNDAPPTTRTYNSYRDKAATKRRTINPGDVLDLGREVQFTCVASNGRVTGGSAIAIGRHAENDRSVALKLRYGRFDYFIGGDLTGGGRSGNRRTKDLETLVASVVGDVDVLRINHHGSVTSSNETFLTALNPEVAVISVGNGGSNRSRYHHPNRPVLDNVLGLRGIQAVFQTNRGETRGGLTDEDLEIIRVARGNVALWSDGNSYVINGAILPVDEAR